MPTLSRVVTAWSVLSPHSVNARGRPGGRTRCSGSARHRPGQPRCEVHPALTLEREHDRYMSNAKALERGPTVRAPSLIDAA
ncbi:hypothetical protein NKH18_50895 [Streptomyces sp. M10(2022)]